VPEAVLSCPNAGLLSCVKAEATLDLPSCGKPAVDPALSCVNAVVLVSSTKLGFLPELVVLVVLSAVVGGT
jgi:hypothetical protein